MDNGRGGMRPLGLSAPRQPKLSKASEGLATNGDAAAANRQQLRGGGRRLAAEGGRKWGADNLGPMRALVAVGRDREAAICRYVHGT